MDNRIVLNLGEVKVDANPTELAALVHHLSTNAEFREIFEADPVTCLRDCGLEISEQAAKRVTPDAIKATLDQLKEGNEVAAIPAPGVAPAIRVGTNPATRPGVNVGVRVVTGSSMVGRPQEETRMAALMAKHQKPEE